MTATRKTALVVCPGRGTYNRDELGYLARHHGARKDIIARFDRFRATGGQETISALDGAAQYSLGRHTRGDNAAALIHSCAYADFLAIDREAFEIIAVTGNSMGWYIALGCGGALNETAAMQVVNTMGSLMHDAMIGGQLIYPLIDENWREVPGRRAQLQDMMALINGRAGQELYISIELGGMLVFAGNEAALDGLAAMLPPEQSRFPLRLANHAASHTPLQKPVSAKARTVLPAALFDMPQTALIDGRGAIWYPHAMRPADLWGYTFGAQVIEPYNFSKAIQVGIREFAPDHIILLGPGSTLGAAVAQSLFDIQWHGLTGKADFLALQKDNPYLLSMGLADQRRMVEVPS